MEEQGFNLATTLTHYQLGARYRWNWKKRLVPTTTVALQLGHATLRMDENIDNDGEEVETRNEAVAMGFEFGGAWSTPWPTSPTSRSASASRLAIPT